MRVPLLLVSIACLAACEGKDDSKAPAGSAARAPNPACELLLGPGDFQRVCGAPITLTATDKEDGDAMFCNRVGPGGVIFVVTRHVDPAQASQATELARSGGLGVEVATRGRYVIELAAQAQGDAPAACDDAQVQDLMHLILEHLREEVMQPE